MAYQLAILTLDPTKLIDIELIDAYLAIEKYLDHWGFTSHKEGTYLGHPQVVNAVKAVMAFQAVKHEFPWFKDAVKDLTLMRVTDIQDLDSLMRFKLVK